MVPSNEKIYDEDYLEKCSSRSSINSKLEEPIEENTNSEAL